MQRPSFTDDAGRVWDLSLNLGGIRRVKADAGIDFGDHTRMERIVGLAMDREALSNVLWSLCSVEAERDGVDRNSFDDSLSGETLDAAAAAVREAYLAFAPVTSRDAIRKGMEQIDATVGASIAAFTAALDSPEYKETVTKLIDDASAEILASIKSM